MSHFFYVIMRVPLPPYVRTVIYTVVGKYAFGVKMDDISQPLESFYNFNQFFTRAVFPRDVPNQDTTLVSPADSKILSIQKVEGDDVVIVKNIKYSLANFLTGEFRAKWSKGTVDGLKSGGPDGDKNATDLYSIVFYLSPGDYHRFHSMARCEIGTRRHVAGELYTVKESFVSKYSVRKYKLFFPTFLSFLIFEGSL